MTRRKFVDVQDQEFMEQADPVLRESLLFCRTQLPRLLNNLPADTDWPSGLTIAVSYIMGFGEAAFGTVRRTEGPIIALDALNVPAMGLCYPHQLVGSTKTLGTNPGVLAWANRNLWEDFVLMMARRSGCTYRAYDTQAQEMGAVLAVEVSAGEDRIREAVMEASPSLFSAGVAAHMLRDLEVGKAQINWEVEVTVPGTPGVAPTWGLVSGVTAVVEEGDDGEGAGGVAGGEPV